MTPPAPMPGAPAGRSRLALLALGATIGLISFNLRPALTSTGPLLPEIMRDFGIDVALASSVSTISLLCLGIFGATAARLARPFGPERVILALLVVLTVGTVLRATGSFAALVAGMVLAGLGIGIVQVLVPGIMKRDFPDHTGLMTGLYTMFLCLGGAVGVGAAIPLRDALGGWQASLMAWGAPAALAALVWVPWAFARRSPAPRVAHPGRLWRDPLAWSVACFMGLQSCLAYTTFALLPLILVQHGSGGDRAGYVSALAIATQMVTALVVPSLAARLRHQSAVAAIAAGAGALGFLGLVFGPPPLAVVFATVMGFGLGATIALAILFMILRSPDSQTASDLSGMAQSVGYVIAAAGPLGAGWLRDASGGWTLPAAFFVTVAALTAAAGWRAGRNAHVLAPRPARGA